MVRVASPLELTLNFLFAGRDLKSLHSVNFKLRYLTSLWKFQTNFAFRTNLPRKPLQSYGEAQGLLYIARARDNTAQI
jgi:hypothetical protein